MIILALLGGVLFAFAFYILVSVGGRADNSDLSDVDNPAFQIPEATSHAAHFGASHSCPDGHGGDCF